MIYSLFILFLFSSLHQIYIFDINFLLCWVFDIFQIKVNNTVGIFRYVEYFVQNTFNTSKLVSIVYDIHQNIQSSVLGTTTSVFEKNIYINNNTTLELYSYNLQKLTQIAYTSITLILFLFLLILLTIKSNKRKV